MRIKSVTAAVMLGASAFGLSACATGFPAQVSRFQAMPAPQGQTFFVVAADPVQQGGLEFNRYAAQVAQSLQAQGYQPATAPAAATMLVRLSFGVDEGTREVSVDPFASSWYSDPFYRGYYDPFYRGYFGRPYYSRHRYWGPRSAFYYGWDDPFWYSPYGGRIDSYTVYKSYVDLDIRRRADNAQLFDGHAKARSTNDNLGVLVPNLIEAMFTGFPGRSGETVRITVPPPKKS